jgi:hypothetical protein
MCSTVGDLKRHNTWVLLLIRLELVGRAIVSHYGIGW